SLRVMARPRPVPPKRCAVVASAWLNSSNSLACCSGVMPMPVSATANSTQRPPLATLRARNVTSPSLVNLQALLRRLSSICRSRIGSTVNAPRFSWASTGCSRAQGPSGASPARFSARQTPGATDNTSPHSPRSGGLHPPCSGPARPEHRPAAASRRSLQACIASLPLLSSLMSKTYLKSDHFNGGGSFRHGACRHGTWRIYRATIGVRGIGRAPDDSALRTHVMPPRSVEYHREPDPAHQSFFSSAAGAWQYFFSHSSRLNCLGTST